MSTNIVKASPASGAIMPQSVDDLIRLGKILAASGYFSDARSEAQAVTKVLAGLELGLSPMVSMTGIHVIEGKPAVGAGLMASLVRRSGRYDYAVIENTDVACEIEFFRDGQTIGRSRFTIEDAKQASTVHIVDREADELDQVPAQHAVRTSHIQRRSMVLPGCDHGAALHTRGVGRDRRRRDR